MTRPHFRSLILCARKIDTTKQYLLVLFSIVILRPTGTKYPVMIIL